MWRTRDGRIIREERALDIDHASVTTFQELAPDEADAP